MNEPRTFSGSHLLIAFATGAAAGAAIALLTAPRSGREMRGALQDWARDVGGKASRLPHAVGQAFERASQAGRTAFTETLRNDGHARSDA